VKKSEINKQIKKCVQMETKKSKREKRMVQAKEGSKKEMYKRANVYSSSLNKLKKQVPPKH
jgi:hypothetical protein